MHQETKNGTKGQITGGDKRKAGQFAQGHGILDRAGILGDRLSKEGIQKIGREEVSCFLLS